MNAMTAPRCNTDRAQQRTDGPVQRRAVAVPRGVSQAHRLYVSHASNAELWDVEGRRFVDFCGGIAVVNTGHCHPRVIQAVVAQLENFATLASRSRSTTPTLAWPNALMTLLRAPRQRKRFS